MTSPLTIALDYDKTYDADPKFWDLFIFAGREAGHDIVLVTFRDDRFDKTPLLKELEQKMPVFYTRGVAKRWWMDQFSPFHKNIHIWIDDNPESIINNSKYTSEELAIWREGDQQKHYPV